VAQPAQVLSDDAHGRLQPPEFELFFVILPILIAVAKSDAVRDFRDLRALRMLPGQRDTQVFAIETAMDVDIWLPLCSRERGVGDEVAGARNVH
jgi:hypothetical protein